MASHRVSATAGIGLLAALLAVPASAQTNERERGYVMGIGGAAMTVVNAPLFGGSVGINLTPTVQITGDLGRLNDVFANFTRDDLASLEQQMLAEEGLTMNTSVKMPTFYATGGVRVIVPTGQKLRPYLTVGAGIAHLNPKPTFLVEGIDVTSALQQEPEFQTVFGSETRPLATVGGGVTVSVVQHLTIDIGYKYSRIFINTDHLQDSTSPHQHNGINVHNVVFGAGYAF